MQVIQPSSMPPTRSLGGVLSQLEDAVSRLEKMGEETGNLADRLLGPTPHAVEGKSLPHPPNGLIDNLNRFVEDLNFRMDHLQHQLTRINHAL